MFLSARLRNHVRLSVLALAQANCSESELFLAGNEHEVIAETKSYDSDDGLRHRRCAVLSPCSIEDRQDAQCCKHTPGHIYCVDATSRVESRPEISQLFSNHE